MKKEGKENQANILRLRELLFGMVDVLAFLLIILPLYPNETDGHIESVNLLLYSQAPEVHLVIYRIVFVALILAGFIKMLLTELKREKENRVVTVLSMGIHIALILFLALAREPYASTVAIVLVVIKGVLLFKGD